MGGFAGTAWKQLASYKAADSWCRGEGSFKKKNLSDQPVAEKVF